MFDWMDVVWGWIMSALAWTWNAILWVWMNFLAFVQWTAQGLQALLNGVVWVARKFWDGLKALRHLNFSRIWAALKRGYNRFLHAYDWWRRHVLGPLDQMRRQIWQIYRTFFKPVIMLLDTFRPIIRMIGLFNRKLAAKLDHRLIALEGKILWPITATLHRLNEISSYFTALITVTGRLSRPLLLESMRRDALLVWEVLTNPRAVLYSPPEPAQPHHTYLQLKDEMHEYCETGTGPVADYVRDALDAMRETRMEVS